MSTERAPAPAAVITALVDSLVEMQAYHDVPGTRDDPQWQAILRRGGDALTSAILLQTSPAPGLEEAVEAARKIDAMARGSALKAGKTYAQGEAEYVDYIRDHALIVARALLLTTRGDEREGVAATRSAEDGSATAPSTDCNP